MSLPRATACADCGKPLRYGSGQWMNVAPMGAKEKIVCGPCWRTKHRPKTGLPVAGVRLPVETKMPPGRPLQGHQPPVEAGVREVSSPSAIQTVAAAFRALVARAVRDEVSREVQRTLARWRNE